MRKLNLTNPHMLACNQNAVTGHPVTRKGPFHVFRTPEHGIKQERGWGGVFNRTEERAQSAFNAAALGLERSNPPYRLYDIWGNRELGIEKGQSLPVALGTVGADKGYEDGEFLEKLECDLLITPHVAIREGKIRGVSVGAMCRRQARRRKRNKGYQISQRIRMRIEHVIGWIKTVAGLERTRRLGAVSSGKALTIRWAAHAAVGWRVTFAWRMRRRL